MSRSKYRIIVAVASLFGLTVVLGACATTPDRPDPREEPARTKIAVEIKQKTLLATAFQKKLRNAIDEAVLETRVGVPVMDSDKADLVIEYEVMTANFTQATSWQWRLVGAKDGAVLHSKRGQASLGLNAEKLAARVVVELADVDTAAYAGEGGTRRAEQTAGGDAAEEDGEASGGQGESGLDSPPESGTDGADAWAVIIGVESYRGELADAPGARADAEAFAAFARTTLNVPEENMKLLVGERATRADVSAALQEWLPRNAVAQGGRVYVFFSGHGTPDVETGESYLLPYDARPRYLKSGGIQVETLRETLSSMEGQRSYVFLDACFSGSGERSVLPKGTRPVVPVKALEEGAGVVTVSAAGADETTGAHPEVDHGLFTYHLLEGLAGAADADADSNITVRELRDHLHATVPPAARRHNRDQMPTVLVPKGIEASETIVRELEAEPVN